MIVALTLASCGDLASPPRQAEEDTPRLARSETEFFAGDKSIHVRTGWEPADKGGAAGEAAFLRAAEVSVVPARPSLQRSGSATPMDKVRKPVAWVRMRDGSSIGLVDDRGGSPRPRGLLVHSINKRTALTVETKYRKIGEQWVPVRGLVTTFDTATGKATSRTKVDLSVAEVAWSAKSLVVPAGDAVRSIASLIAPKAAHAADAEELPCLTLTARWTAASAAGVTLGLAAMAAWANCLASSTPDLECQLGKDLAKAAAMNIREAAILAPLVEACIEGALETAVKITKTLSRPSDWGTGVWGGTLLPDGSGGGATCGTMIEICDIDVYELNGEVIWVSEEYNCSTYCSGYAF